MARAIINTIMAKVRNDASQAVSNTTLFKAIDAANGAEVSWRESDEKYTIVLQNSGSSAGVAVIKAGNGIHGVNDLEVDVPASSTVCLSIDSARFKMLSGEDKGKVILTGPATIGVAVFCTP